MDLGRFSDASEIFLHVIGQRTGPADRFLPCYLQLACCHYSLGDGARGGQCVDSTELAIHACEWLINKAFFSPQLYAFHAARGDEVRANEWLEYLQNLPCPDATKESMWLRGERLVARLRNCDTVVDFLSAFVDVQRWQPVQ